MLHLLGFCFYTTLLKDRMIKFHYKDEFKMAHLVRASKYDALTIRQSVTDQADVCITQKMIYGQDIFDLIYGGTYIQYT